MRFEGRRSRINLRRINVLVNGIHGRLFRGKSLIGGRANFLVDFRFQGLNLLLVENPFAHQKKRQFGNRIAPRLFFAFRGRFVELFVVGQRMGVRARDMRMNQRGTAAFTAVLHGFLADRVAFEWVRAVTFGDVQPRKITH